MVQTAPGCPPFNHAYNLTPQNADILDVVYPLAWRGLPTNLTALDQAIRQRWGWTSTRDPATGKVTRTSDSYQGMIFDDASVLLGDDAPPALRAALFRLMERQPGVISLGPVTDHLGRHGVAVEMRSQDGRSTRDDEFIFDPATSRGLEEDVTQSIRLGHTVRTVSRWRSEYLAAGVVNSLTATLPNRR
jgi:hypothetical protein